MIQKRILNMPSSGFATFSASYPVNYGSLGLEAYAVKLNADTKTITMEKIALGVNSRKKGEAVRVIYDQEMPKELQKKLRERF